MPFWRHRERDDASDLSIVVGLGNPGAQYSRTRHNMGYMVVEAMCERQGVRLGGSKHRADVARTTIDGRPVLLALPLTFMNESGYAVTRLLGYYKTPVDRLLVVCDDLDIPFGSLRLRPSGGSGGNGGLKSIIQQLGTEEFARLRVGVGRPRSSAVSHVLGEFSPEETRLLPPLIEIAADAVTAVIVDGVRDAMNRFNRDWTPEISA